MDYDYLLPIHSTIVGTVQPFRFKNQGQSNVMNILFYLDLITLTCFGQSWSSSEGSSYNQYNIYTSQRPLPAH
jgi:hypothetical protein